MTKKLVATLCAFALALAMPLSAFAADSPTRTLATVEGANGVTLTVSGTAAAGADLMVVQASDHNAANTPAGANVFASFRAFYTDGATDIKGDGSLTLTFDCGAANAGRAITVYIEHEKEGVQNETSSGVVAADGTYSFSINELSYFTVVLGDRTDTITNGSSTSPQTGLPVAPIAGLTVLAVAVSAGAFVGLRKMSR